jgi:hypothetical protein
MPLFLLLEADLNMSPSPKREKFEAFLGAIIAGGTPWFVWAYLQALYPDLPEVGQIDPDLWAYLLQRVLLFSVLIEFSFVVIAMLMRRRKMVRMILTISAMYLLIALYYRWEWL